MPQKITSRPINTATIMDIPHTDNLYVVGKRAEDGSLLVKMGISDTIYSRMRYYEEHEPWVRLYYTFDRVDFIDFEKAMHSCHVAVDGREWYPADYFVKDFCGGNVSFLHWIAPNGYNSRMELGKEYTSTANSYKVYNTRTKEVWPSMTSICEEFGYNQKTLRAWLNGSERNPTPYKYYFQHVIGEMPELRKKTNNRQVLCIKTGAVHDSIRLAAESVGMGYAKLRGILNKGENTGDYGRCTFRYLSQGDEAKKFSKTKSYKCQHKETGEVYNSITSGCRAHGLDVTKQQQYNREGSEDFAFILV